MHQLPQDFIRGAKKLGADPKTTRNAIFFDQVSLEVSPYLDSENLWSLELVWPMESHDFDSYPALLYSLVLGWNSSFGNFLEAAGPSVAGGCGYQEPNGEWAVRIAPRQARFHLSFTAIHCLERTGPASCETPGGPVNAGAVSD